MIIPMPDDIQLRALETWYNEDHKLHGDLEHPIIGLGGEAGELLNLVKKYLFKLNAEITREQFLDELGDVLYYLAIIAYQLGVTLEELSQMNYDKLAAREASGRRIYGYEVQGKQRNLHIGLGKN